MKKVRNADGTYSLDGITGGEMRAIFSAIRNDYRTFSRDEDGNTSFGEWFLERRKTCTRMLSDLLSTESAT